MPNISGTRTLNVTLLSIRVDAETLGMALSTADERHWAVTPLAFDGYISAKRRPHFADNLRAGDGCVALVNFDEDPKQAVAAAIYLQQVFDRRIVVIAIAAENQPHTMLLAMRAGCTEFLSEVANPQVFADAFRRVEQQFANRNATSNAAGSILAFLGAKGGVGTTTLSVHLACYLAQRNGKKVLLIDNKAQFGHICIYLGLDGSAFHFQEVVRNVSRLDSELLRGFIATHSSGLNVLSSPDVGQVAKPMHPADVAAALEFLRTEYDFVLVDCTNTLDEINNVVIGASAQVYVVATPEISALRDLSRYIDDLTQTEDNNKIRAVINRYSSQFAVSLEQIEKAIRLPVSFNVPNAYVELVRSANLGEPLSPELKSGFTTEITRWADSLVGATAGSAPVTVPASSPLMFCKLLKNAFIGSKVLSGTPVGKGA